jgi:hypothetical protein
LGEGQVRLTIVKLGKGGNMFDERRRPAGRLFYLLAFVVVGLGVSRGQTPATSTISEVPWTDFGWGQDNDRNLAGRFSTQTVTVTRLGKIPNYFLRQYDASTPPKYSRYTTALHLNTPL